MLSEENAVFSKNVTVPDADGIFSQMAFLFYMILSCPDGRDFYTAVDFWRRI